MNEHQGWRRMTMVAAALVLACAWVHAQGGSRDAHDHASAERVALIAKALSIGPGATVADIGAGRGDYTMRLAALVGEAGRVYAVDIDPGALVKLRTRVERDGRSNVVVQEGAVDDPRLPDGSLDAAIIVHAYHEMTEHRAMLTRVRAALKPGGRLAIVEPIAEERRTLSRDQQTARHQIAPDVVLREVRAAGFEVVGLQDPFQGGREHGDHAEWLLVAVRAAATPAEPRGDASGAGFTTR